MIRIVTSRFRLSQKDLLKITGAIAREISEQITAMPVPQRGFEQYNIDVDIKISPVRKDPVVKVMLISEDEANEQA